MNQNFNSIHYQKLGVDYLIDRYGYAYNKALSIFRKIQYRLAQKSQTLKTTEQGNLDKLTYESITNVTSTTTTRFYPKKDTFTLTFNKQSSTGDAFKDEVLERLSNFRQKYKGTWIENWIQKYENGEIDYNLLEWKIDLFKTWSPQYDEVGSK